MRHSWLSSGRRESVAEHTWRMALMAMLLQDYLETKVDLLRTLKMILVHDLVEVNYKDNPAFKIQPSDKEAQERRSLQKLLKKLPEKMAKEIEELWEEYENKESSEAKFAVAIDKLEVLLQHNEADIRHLTRKEIPFNFIHGIEQSKYDSFLKGFRELINDEFLSNYRRNKINKELYDHILNEK